MINLEKLDQAIGWIEANPQLHNQGRWFSRGDGGCGTACCLAGAIALLDGWEPAEWTRDGHGGRESTAVARRDDTTGMVDEIAMDALGANRSPDHEPYTGDEQACQDLFEGDNTLDDIKRIRDEIAAGAL